MTTGSEFVLHPRLAADTHPVVDWSLSCVRLMNDARYWWILLVPRRRGVSEIHELGRSDRVLLVEEIARASGALNAATGARKINIGALGNIVSQLHVHVVARFEGDPAWPGPVWGHSPAAPLEPSLARERISALEGAFAIP